MMNYDWKKNFGRNTQRTRLPRTKLVLADSSGQVLATGWIGGPFMGADLEAKSTLIYHAGLELPIGGDVSKFGVNRGTQ